MSTSAPHRRSARPFLWLLFSAGGMAAALVLPVLLFLFGLAFPLGLLDAPDHAHLLAVVRNPLSRCSAYVCSPCSTLGTASGSRSSTGCNWAGSTV